MPLLSQNESNFEFALRLTRALKYAENEGVMRSNAQGMYIDSKTVLDVLYAEVTATKENWNSPYTLTDQGFSELVTLMADDVSEIQRASVSERSYHPHIPFDDITPVSKVQQTISKAFAPCGKTNNYPE